MLAADRSVRRGQTQKRLLLDVECAGERRHFVGQLVAASESDRFGFEGADQPRLFLHHLAAGTAQGRVCLRQLLAQRLILRIRVLNERASLLEIRYVLLFRSRPTRLLLLGVRRLFAQFFIGGEQLAILLLMELDQLSDDEADRLLGLEQS